MANLRKDLTDSGVQRIGNWHDLDSNLWPELFLDATDIDIVLAYSLQSSQRVRIEAADQRGARIRAFLPDPDDGPTMETHANRFQMPSAHLQTRVRETIAELTAIANRSPSSKMCVYVRPGDLVYSCYRFNSRAVMTLYSHSKERQSYVPTLVLQGGDLLGYLLRDLDSMASQGRLVSCRQEQHRGQHD